MFPSPVGGPVNDSDFTPSIVFIVLFAFIVVGHVIQSCRRKSSLAYAGAVGGIAVERIVVYALRLRVSVGDQASSGLVAYLQLTFGMAYLIIANELVLLCRCFLEKSTMVVTQDIEVAMKLPVSRRRYWYRRAGDALSLLFIASFVIAAVSSSYYEREDISIDPWVGHLLMALRYSSASIGVFSLGVVLAGLCFSYTRIQNIDRFGCLQLIHCVMLLSVIGIYRLAVMNNYTESFTSTGPGSLANEKTMFYLFHALPEWLVTLMLLCAETRPIYGLVRPWDKDCGAAWSVQSDNTPAVPEKMLISQSSSWSSRLLSTSSTSCASL